MLLWILLLSFVAGIAQGSTLERRQEIEATSARLDEAKSRAGRLRGQIEEAKRKEQEHAQRVIELKNKIERVRQDTADKVFELRLRDMTPAEKERALMERARSLSGGRRQEAALSARDPDPPRRTGDRALKDPTAPPGALLADDAPEAAPSAPGVPRWVITMTRIRPGQHLARINGEWAGPGEEIDGAEVVLVRQGTALLRVDGELRDIERADPGEARLWCERLGTPKAPREVRQYVALGCVHREAKKSKRHPGLLG